MADDNNDNDDDEYADMLPLLDWEDEDDDFNPPLRFGRYVAEEYISLRMVFLILRDWPDSFYRPARRLFPPAAPRHSPTKREDCNERGR